MLTAKDIKQLSAALASKDGLKEVHTSIRGDIEIVRRETQIAFHELHREIAALRETVQALSVSVEKLAEVIDDFRQENAAVRIQLSRHERWIMALAKKIKVSLGF